jgi:CRISPR/Cas system-associated exonuclease Cas4 (RecB family)
MSVPSWSHSKLKDFDKCKRMFWLKHDQKIPEPERTLKPGQTEFANDRGTRIHEECELFINGTHDDLCPEAAKYFSDFFCLMRAMYGDGLVIQEHEWGHDKDWEIAEWKKAWLRLKLDAMVRISPTEAWVLDWKTGRKFGNEVGHMEQLQLYTLCTFMRHPELETVRAELIYIDQGETTFVQMTRSQALRFRQGFDKRGIAATSCEVFPPNPNRWSCLYCSYKNTEHCAVGV